MNVEPVIARLRTEIAAFASRVGGAAEAAAALEAEALAAPAAWVIPVEEEAGESLTAGIAQHVIAERFDILVVVDNTTDRRGDAAHVELETLRQALFAALLGWQPAAALWPVTYVGGGLVQMTRDRLWWQFEFETAEIIQG